MTSLITAGLVALREAAAAGTTHRSSLHQARLTGKNTTQRALMVTRPARTGLLRAPNAHAVASHMLYDYAGRRIGSKYGEAK